MDRTLKNTSLVSNAGNQQANRAPLLTLVQMLARQAARQAGSLVAIDVDLSGRESVEMKVAIDTEEGKKPVST